eukprot:TRINITY_DN47464_c0_g1_i1.p1 TRINITY_DN47464_c0_g1~~TRINITY_DN47464_c0_g1_i1.p1  ORF type:complete len:289 (+),score=68.95 TRINITY_DN47464_c0_g1_i1:58-867(+)
MGNQQTNTFQDLPMKEFMEKRAEEGETAIAPEFVDPYAHLWKGHFPEWIRALPRTESDVLNARQVTSVGWLFRSTQMRASGFGKLELLPDPFVDPMDRPEAVIGLFPLVAGFSGLLKGTRTGRQALQSNQQPRGVRPGRYMAATSAAYCLRWAGSGLVWGVAALAGDRGVMMVRRKIAEKQGAVLKREQDVVRTPLNYAVALSCTFTTFMWLDIRKPRFFYNFAQWASAGFAVGYLAGVVCVRARELRLRDLRDQEALAAFRERRGDND